MTAKKAKKANNGKGDKPRNNSSSQFKDNYEKIDWSFNKKNNKEKI